MGDVEGGGGKGEVDVEDDNDVDRSRQPASRSSGIHLACEMGALAEGDWRACHELIARSSAMLGALVRRCA